MKSRLLENLWERMKGHSPGTLYLHYPCFDGIITGVLAWDFLEVKQGWIVDEVCPVNYNLRDEWLNTRLKRRAAVVDFLYHPDALFWVDHHSTTFLDANSESDFQKRKAELPLLYDNLSGSSASLLWRAIGKSVGRGHH